MPSYTASTANLTPLRLELRVKSWGEWAAPDFGRASGKKSVEEFCHGVFVDREEVRNQQVLQGRWISDDYDIEKHILEGCPVKNPQVMDQSNEVGRCFEEERNGFHNEAMIEDGRWMELSSTTGTCNRK